MSVDNLEIVLLIYKLFKSSEYSLDMILKH